MATPVYIDLDTNKAVQAVPPEVSARVGDGGGIEIVATVTTNGEAFALGSRVAKLCIARPDGAWVRLVARPEQDGGGAATNVFHVTLNSNALAVAGFAQQCFIGFFDSDGAVRDSTGDIQLYIAPSDVQDEGGAAYYDEQLNDLAATWQAMAEHAEAFNEWSEENYGRKEAEREQKAEDARDAQRGEFDAAQAARSHAFSEAAATWQAMADAFSDEVSAWEADEAQRGANEAARIDNEAQRAAKEAIRIDNEDARQLMESAREAAEDARAAAEGARADAEDARAAAESERKGAEGTRQANEETRQANEAERQKATADMKATLAQAMDQMAANVVVFLQEGEYDPETGAPSLSTGVGGTIYLSPDPDADGPNRYIEWIFAGGRWEPFGKTSAKFEEIAADVLARIWGGEELPGTAGLSQTGLNQLRAYIFADFERRGSWQPMQQATIQAAVAAADE